MTTAVDTAVLLDVLAADPAHGPRSREDLREAYFRGSLITCDVVWAEVRAHFPDDEAFTTALRLLGVSFSPLSAEAGVLAGRLWQAHRRHSRARPTRVVADFLVGAHARLQSDALHTRDRGFYRTYFAGLRVIDPSRH